MKLVFEIGPSSSFNTKSQHSVERAAAFASEIWDSKFDGIREEAERIIFVDAKHVETVLKDRNAPPSPDRKRVLICTVGLPRSGKSTWARSSGLPIVCPDAIRLSIHGQAFFSPAEPLVWAIAHIMVSSLFKAGHETVVLDATNVTVTRRNEWRKDAEEVVYKIFDTPPAECVHRAKAGGREDLVPVIKRMAKEADFAPHGPTWFNGME
jgi:predicted kinase